MNKKSHEVVERFVEQMGMNAQADGLPRIAGKIMGLMMVENGPFSFGELAERLGVSRGSISTNTRLMETLGIIERVSKTGARGDYFQMATNPYLKVLGGVEQRMKRTLATVKEARDQLPTEWKDAQRRLSESLRFYQTFLASMQALKVKFEAESGL